MRRALKTMGIKCSPAVVKPFVSESNAAKRVDWCKERLDWTVSDWNKVVWFNKSKFQIFGLDRILNISYTTHIRVCIEFIC